jgi:predicted lipid-binding transport protein (Tim44 family)
MFSLRQLSVALVLVAAMFCLSACGDRSDGDASTTTTSSAVPTSKTGSTKSRPKSTSNQKKKESSGNSSSGSGKPAPQSDDTPSTLKSSPPSALSAADANAVRESFKKIVVALDRHDVAYLCKTAFSRDWVRSRQAEGGCTASTEKSLDGITSYSAKIKSVGAVPNSSLAQVYATVSPVTATGKRNIKATIYFEKEDGSWKRTVPPSS